MAPRRGRSISPVCHRTRTTQHTSRRCPRDSDSSSYSTGSDDADTETVSISINDTHSNDQDAETRLGYQQLFDAYYDRRVRVAEAEARLRRAYHTLGSMFSRDNVMIRLGQAAAYCEKMLPILIWTLKWILILAVCIGIPWLLLFSLLRGITYLCTSSSTLSMLSYGIAYTPYVPDVCAEVEAFNNKHMLAKTQFNQTFDSLSALSKLFSSLKEVSKVGPPFRRNAIELHVQIGVYESNYA